MRRVIRGIDVSPGVAIGAAFIRGGSASVAGETPAAIDAGAELARLEHAAAQARAELHALQDRLRASVGAERAAIFSAQALMLDDPALWSRFAALVREDGLPAEVAVERATAEFAATLAALGDPLLSERAADVRDVGRRLLTALDPSRPGEGTWPEGPVVLVTRDLLPSEAAQLDSRLVIGLATEEGGPTSHSAILLRGLGVPAVFGAAGLLAAVRPGDRLIVDADRGEVLVGPTAAQAADYQRRAGAARTERERLAGLKDLPAATEDGHRVELGANIGSPADVAPALQHGAEGVGLFRTEFLYLGRESVPSEEEQYTAYRDVVVAMSPRPVIIRTADIGGDKELPHLGLAREANPFLGLRGVRLGLHRPDLLRAQLRAILRASAHGPVRVMFPMVATMEEARLARGFLAEVRQELVAAGVPCDAAMPVGIMVEVPAAALLAAELAREVDFFSVGSNDLVQYTLAVDRGNPAVAALYQPLHPAVLRLLKEVVDAAHAAGRWVGICGEMAGDPLAAPLLLGLGLDELSMSPGQIPRIKEVIRAWRYADAASLARRALGMTTAAEVRQAVEAAR